MLAGAVAEAMRPGASTESVIEVAVGLAHDGTRAAIEAVTSVATEHYGLASALGPLRDAVAPFDTVGRHYRQPAMDARRPSRTKSIEELPIALGLLVVAGGDYREAVLGAVNYGRDSDSIATMAGAITGALGGAEVVPQDWLEQVSTASRVDLVAPATTLADVARDIWRRDADRVATRDAARRLLR